MCVVRFVKEVGSGMRSIAVRQRCDSPLHLFERLEHLGQLRMPPRVVSDVDVVPRGVGGLAPSDDAGSRTGWALVDAQGA
jgi:hypothetical protein